MRYVVLSYATALGVGTMGGYARWVVAESVRGRSFRRDSEASLLLSGLGRVAPQSQACPAGGETPAGLCTEHGERWVF